VEGGGGKCRRERTNLQRSQTTRHLKLRRGCPKRKNPLAREGSHAEDHIKWAEKKVNAGGLNYRNRHEQRPCKKVELQSGLGKEEKTLKLKREATGRRQRRSGAQA